MRMRQLRRRTLHGRTLVVDGKANPVASTGPGSIRCEAQIQQLIDANKLGEAHRLAVNHLRECGGDERRIKPKYRPDAIERLIMESNNIGSSS
jgi:hypothetical protein